MADRGRQSLLTLGGKSLSFGRSGSPLVAAALGEGQRNGTQDAATGETDDKTSESNEGRGKDATLGVSLPESDGARAVAGRRNDGIVGAEGGVKDGSSRSLESTQVDKDTHGNALVTGTIHTRPETYAQLYNSRIVSQLERNLVYWQIKRIVKEEIIKPQYAAQELEPDVTRLMKELGLETRLRNIVYSLYQNDKQIAKQEAVRAGSAGGGCAREVARGSVRRGRDHARGLGGLSKTAVPKRRRQLTTYETFRDPLEVVNAARKQWDEGICEEVMSLAAEQRRPIARRRSEAEVEAIGRPSLSSTPSGGDGGGSGSHRSSKGARGAQHKGKKTTTDRPVPVAAVRIEPPARFLFDCEDLLEAVAQIENKNHNSSCAKSWGMIQLRMMTPAMEELRLTFADVHPTKRQVGLDDLLLIESTATSSQQNESSTERGGSSRSSSGRKRSSSSSAIDASNLSGPSSSAGSLANIAESAPNHWNGNMGFAPAHNAFMTMRSDKDRRIVDEGFIADVRARARSGIPNSLRPQAWKRILAVELTEEMRNYFDILQKQVARWDLLVDDLYAMDVQHCVNDDIFFPFEDILRSLLMAFSRDPWVLQNAAVPCHAPLQGPGSAAGLAKADTKLEEGGIPSTATIPSCGVQPFQGLVMYAAPLCYVYTDEAEAFFVFRQMWCSHWCRLNSISSRRGGLISICKMFEVLLQKQQPEVFHHLLQLGITPLRIAFPWIHHAFVGYLEVDQVLILWDRILAWGDRGLELLPILSVAIFAFRARALLGCGSVQSVQDAFGDPSKLHVIPLLQVFLFA